MKQRRTHLIISLSLIVLTVGFIWINSALPGQDSSQLSDRVRAILEKIMNFMNFPDGIRAFLLSYVRKVAHAVEYAVIGAELGFLWSGLGKGFQGLWNAWSAVLAISVCDETIQLFAMSRGPQITDVLLDTVSGTVGILIVYLLWIIIKCIRNKGE